MAKMERLTYETYLTDALKIACENTARLGGGSYIQMRYIDLLASANKPEETRTGDEVKDHMKALLGSYE